MADTPPLPSASAEHANAISTPVLSNEKQETALQRLREMIEEQFKDNAKLTKHGLIPKGSLNASISQVMVASIDPILLFE